MANAFGLIDELIRPETLRARRDREPHDVSLREQIVEAWNSSPVIFGNTENLDHLPVLLDTHGTYDTSMLLLRLDMLAEIEGGVDRLNLSLYRLHREMLQ